MRDRVIKAMVTAGVPADKADKYWATARERLNDGDELTEAALAALKDSAIEAVMPAVPAAAFISAIREKGEAPKGKKFKPGRPYTATEYAEHYQRDPENEAIAMEVARATDGKPWVVFHEGKYHTPQMAKYIQWHMDEDIAPATIDVDGMPVAPVMPGEERRKEAKEYPVDPHTPGGFLDVNNKSPRTGADFTGYTEEETQATIMAYAKLQRMDDIALQRFTDDMRGKGAVAILKPFPELAAVWNRTKPADRPKTKATKRPFAEPIATTTAPRDGMTAPSGFAPTLHFVGVEHARPAWERLKKLVGPSPRVRLTCDAEMPAGGFVSEVLAQRLAAADAVMALLNADSIAAGSHVVNFNGPTVPVVVGVCFSEYAFPGAVTLPRDGNPPTNDREWAALAKGILDFAATLRPRAKAATGPAWLSAAPFPHADPDAAAFYASCVVAYPDAATSRTLCLSAGMNTGDVAMGGSPRVMWGSILEAAARQGKTGALFTQILGDSSVSAHFNRWR